MTTATTPTKSAQRPSASLSDETLIEWLRMMQLIREFETRTMQSYANAEIGGFCHVYTGQEACAVGAMACVDKSDPVITAYRDHGHALARGMHPNRCMAEMYGKITGCAKGKGGSMHMFDRPNWLFGGHGIVGAHTPLAAGLAFASKYEREVMEKGEKKVTLCFLGDGALNQGAFHEAMNLAGLFDLPVVYLVENNRYSMGTHIERGTTMANDLPKKAEAYGIEGTVIDGFDALNLYDNLKPLIDRCRDEQRPAFVDVKTYRYYGHSMSDPQKYRTKEEVQEVKERDSIDLLLKHLVEDRGCITEDEFSDMKKELRSTVRDAIKFAEDSDEPDIEKELYSDVYLNPENQTSPMRDYIHGAENPLLKD